MRNLPKLCFLDSPFDGQRKIQNQPHENKPAEAAQDDEHRLGVARGWGWWGRVIYPTWNEAKTMRRKWFSEIPSTQEHKYTGTQDTGNINGHILYHFVSTESRSLSLRARGNEWEFWRSVKVGAGEMTQELTALAALADLGSLANTYTGWLRTSWDSSFDVFQHPMWALLSHAEQWGVPSWDTDRHTMYTNKNQIKLRKTMRLVRLYHSTVSACQNDVLNSFYCQLKNNQLLVLSAEEKEKLVKLAFARCTAVSLSSLLPSPPAFLSSLHRVFPTQSRLVSCSFSSCLSQDHSPGHHTCLMQSKSRQ